MIRTALVLALVSSAYGIMFRSKLAETELTIDDVGGDLFPEEIEAMKKNHKMLPFKFKVVANKKEDLKPHMFVHVHKSLGSWMCAQARINGASHPEPNMCTLPQDLPWRNFFVPEFLQENTCEKRASAGYKFQQVERWMDWGREGADARDYCPAQFSYSFIMRDPILRAKSQMQANNQPWRSVSMWLDANATQPVKPFAQRWMQSHVPYDNFFVRTLASTDAFFAPLGGVTREHLELAKQHLDALDAVMVADDLLTQIPQLERLTGWTGLTQQASHQVHNNGCASEAQKRTMKCKSLEMPAEEEARWKFMNKLDYELYDYAHQVAAKKTQALL